MTLEKIVKKSFSNRIKTVIIGSDKPNVLTQISVWIGFVSSLYLASWHLITLLTLLFLDTLKNSAHLRASFDAIGRRNYNFQDTINKLWFYAISELIIFGVILFGLALIWRKKKLGFLLYVFGNLSTVFITIVFMGFDFIKKEGVPFDYILIGILTLYFTIGIFIFYRKKIDH